MIPFLTRYIAKKIEEVARKNVKLCELENRKQLSQEDKDKVYSDSVIYQVNELLSLSKDVNRQELYMALQIEEIESEENEYYAGLSLNRQPNKEEKAEHYCNGNRPLTFEQNFRFILSSEEST